MGEPSIDPGTSPSPGSVRRCNTCGCALDRSGGQPAYHLVPAGQMDRAAAGGPIPWSLWLCAACYQREHA